jgi:predicted TIM-barrel fold metal-dependent hydrolase
VSADGWCVSPVILGLALGLACGSQGDREASPVEVTPAEVSPAAVPVAPVAIDAHVHLTGMDAAEPLLELMDELGIARAVVLSSPHLTPGEERPGLAGADDANRRVLEAARRWPDRFVPFVTVDFGVATPDVLASWRADGACGFKLYQGHRELRTLPLDDPGLDPAFDWLEQHDVPLLMHVNTFRYEDELVRRLEKHPELRAVCAHFCGSRTDPERLQRILTAFPRLWMDTSHGQGAPGADGFAAIESNRELVRALILAQPERFIFGSDLVTLQDGPTWREDWAMHLRANLGLLRDASFTSWRRHEGVFVPGTYAGLELPSPPLPSLLMGNAERWLEGCLAPRG